MVSLDRRVAGGGRRKWRELARRVCDERGLFSLCLLVNRGRGKRKARKISAAQVAGEQT